MILTLFVHKTFLCKHRHFTGTQKTGAIISAPVFFLIQIIFNRRTRVSDRSIAAIATFPERTKMQPRPLSAPVHFR